jgi:hypothetical protein
MDQGLSIETMILLAGFAVLVALAAWHRTRLDAEIEALPQALRDRLGWALPGDASLRRQRRRIADRLVLRGLPHWVPLSGQGRRHLLWLRVLGLGSALYIVVVPPLVAGVWVLLAMLGAPVVLFLGLRGWLVGPWEGSR